MTDETKVAASDLKADEFADYVADLDREEVQRLLQEEKDGKDRSTAKDALEARLAELDEEDNGNAGDGDDEPDSSEVNGVDKRDFKTAPKHDPQASTADGTLPVSKVNAREVIELETPAASPSTVDMASARPQDRARQIAARRANREKEGPIAGEGSHRLAAPAPAGVPGEQVAAADPLRHDARREHTGAIAPPAPTRGAAVESPAPTAPRAEVEEVRQELRDERKRAARASAATAPPAPVSGYGDAAATETGATTGSGRGGGGVPSTGPG